MGFIYHFAPLKGEVNENPVYIEWTDTVSDGVLWMDKEMAIEWANDEAWIIKQVGFVIKATAKYILLAAMINLQHSSTKVSGLSKIPKSTIIKRVKL